MNHGTQLSPAEFAAMWGTELLALVPEELFGEPVAGPPLLASALFCEAFGPLCPEPPPFPPDEVEDPPEPLVWVLEEEEEELGATGIVDWGVPLEPEELGLLLLPPPPTPGSAEPYWSWEGELAPAVGGSTAAKSAITEIATTNRGV